MQLYVVNSRQVQVPPGYAKVRGFIQGDDRIWNPDVASWDEVVISRPELLGRQNHTDTEADLWPVIRANENF